MRQHRLKPQRRVPEIGVNKGRISNISQSVHGHVMRSMEQGDAHTPYGVRRRIFSGPYEVYMEAFAPLVNTGKIQHETGTATFLVESGTLFFGTFNDNQNYQITRVRAGENITANPKTAYSLATGEVPVTLLRIQTSNYAEGLSTAETDVPAKDPNDARMVTLSPAEKEIRSPEGPAVVNPSRDPAYRQHMAQLLKSDNPMRYAHSRRKKERLPVPQTADEVIHPGKTFIDPTVAAERIGSITGVNLSVADLAGLDAIAAEDAR